MAKTNGRMLKCDRCGKTKFVKFIGHGEMDGGFTRCDKFESAPDWTYEHGIGDLCPKCSEEFELIIYNFKKAKGDFMETSEGHKCSDCGRDSNVDVECKQCISNANEPCTPSMWIPKGV